MSVRPDTASWSVELFFDGDCPLCRREVELLNRRNRYGRVRFTDIASHDFEATTVGKSQVELMARIHARCRSGIWMTGVDAFERVYAALQLRWLAALLRWPPSRALARLAYRIFARYRLRLTGRCSSFKCS